jgi:beta-galactosidase
MFCNVRRLFILFFLAISIPTFANNPEKRERYLMDFNWKFIQQDIDGAQNPGFNDGDWRTLDLPHDWSVEGEFSRDAPGGGRVAYLPTGIGWYRKSFDLPVSAAGNYVWIEFDGVYMNSTVWINGKELGMRPFGYIGFAYDLTPHLRPGKNTIAVRVDNSKQPNSRWYSGSGIYRHVWLNITDNLRIDFLGTHIITSNITDDKADIIINTRLVNNHSSRKSGILRTVIIDQTGKEVKRFDLGYSVNSGQSTMVKNKNTVPSPKLWGLKNPHLYTLHQMVMEGNRIVDDQVTVFGIRKIEYDSKRGFLLNGEQTKMKGVNLHHDGGAVGAAVPERVWERRLIKMKEMGVNAIRTAHNPPAPEFLDLCDKLGFLVMDEPFDEWTHGKVEFGYNKYYKEWSQRDLIDFIRRDRNHPSVVMWSAGNEIGEQSVDGGEEILKPLIETFHREDPTRPVTTGNDHIAADGRTAKLPFLNMLDIVGYNYMDRWHKRREIYNSEDKINNPNWKMVGTESASVRNIRSEYKVTDDIEATTYHYTSGMIRAAELWKFVSMHDYVIGDFMWTGIDYLGEARWPDKNASSGELDLAGFEKDGFYFYQSQWTEDPVLHVFPHWNWKGKEGRFLQVVAYTNCDSVLLYLNDKLIGTRVLEFPRQGTSGGWNRYERPYLRTTTADLHASWDVPYEPGTLRAVGKRAGKLVSIYEIKTTGEPAAIRLSADRQLIKSDKRDVVHVKVEIVDENGLVVPTASNEIEFSVDGVGKLIAVDNGDPSDHDSFQHNKRKAFNGLALAIIQSSDESGTIRIKATSPGLKDSNMEVKTDNSIQACFNYTKAIK